MTYLTPDVIGDETSVSMGILAAIMDTIAGWTSEDAQLEAAFAEALGIAIATAITVMQAQALSTYTGFGANILGISRTSASPATCTSTWTLVGTDGGVIPAGTQVTATKPDGSALDFVTAAETDIPALTTVVTGVVLIAIEAGADTNGATNPATQEEIDGIASVTIEAPSTNGTDDEADADYATDVANGARRMHKIPIVAADFADYATDVPGVARCAVLNLYAPPPPSGPDDNPTPGHLTLYPVDSVGQPSDGDHVAAIVALFALIETPLNVTIHYDEPTYVSVTIAATIKVSPDADDGVTATTVQNAIASYMAEGTYDFDEDADGHWANPRSTGVTIFDIDEVIRGVVGVDAVTAITVNGTTHVDFTDPVTLPHLTGAATITVA